MALNRREGEDMKFTFNDRKYVVRNDIIRGVNYGDKGVSILIGSDEDEALVFNADDQENLVSVREAVIRWTRDWYKS
jgi:hypothetical protein